MSVYERKIPQWKVDAVDELAETIKNSQMIGLVNVEGVGAKQLQGIRDNLRGSATLKMARNTLMIRALEKAEKKGIKNLIEFVQGPVAFMFSEQDPFALSKFLSENRAAAPAKGGQVSPKDITIPAMNTGVAPGPFISELAALKIPSRVKGGVIHVIADTVAVKAGETISNAMAQMLSRLGIEPMELQLRLVAAYTDGSVLTSEVFEIDVDDLLNQVLLGHQFAVNLSVNIGFPTSESMPIILAKAEMEAKNLALNILFFTPELIDMFLVKANSEALALAAKVAEKNPDAIPSDVLTQVQTSAASAPATTPAADTAPAEEEPEKEEEEEEVAGIGGLFG